jgi:hypothetical protein
MDARDLRVAGTMENVILAFERRRTISINVSKAPALRPPG